MNETLLRPLFSQRLDEAGSEGAPGGGSGAGGGSAPAGEGAPSPGTSADGAPASGSGSPAAAGAPAAPAPKDTRSASERAYARAEEKRNKGKTTSPAGGEPAGSAQPRGEAAPGQALAGDKAGGASTEGDAAAADGKPAGEAADGKGGKPSGSTVEIPADWPTEDREKIAKLPDEGQQLVLDIHKRMHAGFSHAMNQLAEERTRRQDLFALDEKFQRGDAKGVIGELAKRAGLEVFFERPLPEGEIPEDIKADPVKYANYIRDQATRSATEALRKDQQEREAKATQERAVNELKRELGEAATAHTDFDERRPAVMQLIARAPGLSVEEAYRLATFEPLAKRAAAADQAEKDLAATRAELEKLRKAATQPPVPPGPGGDQKPDTRHLSAGERAYNRASARRNAGA